MIPVNKKRKLVSNSDERNMKIDSWNDSPLSTCSTVDIASKSQLDSLYQCAVHQPPRTVRFSPHVRVQEITHRTEFPAGEIEARWINSHDYAMTRQESDLTEAVMKLEDKRHWLDDKNLCARGVESTESLIARAESNSFLKQVVLHQFRQPSADKKSLDERLDLIGQLYGECSAPAALRAVELAAQDERDAQVYYADFAAATNEAFLLAIARSTMSSKNVEGGILKKALPSSLSLKRPASLEDLKTTDIIERTKSLSPLPKAKRSKTV